MRRHDENARYSGLIRFSMDQMGEIISDNWDSNVTNTHMYVKYENIKKNAENSLFRSGTFG